MRGKLEIELQVLDVIMCRKFVVIAQPMVPIKKMQKNCPMMKFRKKKRAAVIGSCLFDAFVELGASPIILILKMQKIAT